MSKEELSLWDLPCYFAGFSHLCKGVVHLMQNDYSAFAGNVGWIFLAWMIINLKNIFEYLQRKYDEDE